RGRGVRNGSKKGNCGCVALSISRQRASADTGRSAMGRVTFYSSSRRSHLADRRAQFRPQGPIAASAATEKGAADTEAPPRQRGRFMTALKRVEKPLLIAGGVFFALALVVAHSSLQPVPRACTQADI